MQVYLRAGSIERSTNAIDAQSSPTEGRRPRVLAPLTPSRRKVEPQPYAPTHASCASTCSAAARRMFQRISLLTAATYARAELTTTSVSDPEPENFRDVV